MSEKQISIYFIILVLCHDTNYASPNKPLLSTEISAKSAPYMVNLLYDGQHYCSGSYIMPYWVLTTAHCIRGKLLVYTIAKMGAKDDIGSEFERRIRLAVQHGLYKPIGSKRRDYNVTWAALNNVGLIMISEPFEIGETIKIIDFAKAKAKYEGQIAKMAGWGKVCNNDTHSEKLREVDIPLVHCDDYVLCPTWINSTHDETRCRGDSGSPIVLNYQIIGIVVCGYYCGELVKTIPTTFIQIYPHAQWIDEQILSK